MNIKKILLTAAALITIMACVSGCGQADAEAASATANSKKSAGLTTNSSLIKFNKEQEEEKGTTKEIQSTAASNTRKETTTAKTETDKQEAAAPVSDATNSISDNSKTDCLDNAGADDKTEQQTTIHAEQPAAAKEDTAAQKAEEPAAQEVETTPVKEEQPTTAKEEITTQKTEEETTTTKQEEAVEEETECSHCWRTIRTKTPVYRTITHEAVTHEEYTTVQKPLYMTVVYINCKACGWSTRVADSIHESTMEGYEAFDIHICECHDGHAQSYLSYKDEAYDYEEVVETVTVVDEEAWTETYIDGYTEEFSHYQCFKCGAVRK